MKRRRKPLSRAQIMSRIRSKDTKPEMLLRRALRAAGIGYRLHVRGMPGRPDVVLKGAKLAVFVHGCFWHRHPGCAKASFPKNDDGFWAEKFVRNVRRDRRMVDALKADGWEVGILWECEAMRTGDLELAVECIRAFMHERVRRRRRSSG